ncbi:hypothetical protein BD310DRAFT_960479 [Dichomitus squalens]|uniref:Protein kinase domain-containing protein n=1 Tax=Dichomitus squalens TaxID=114155 RepID=A0A4Q9PPI3_9APHY|nr:hypothetical protein BD310DRAFT_960479 [Dichomitus squalens]
MGDSSPRLSSRATNENKPRAWGIGGHQSPSGTAPVPLKMTHPLQVTSKEELGSGRHNLSSVQVMEAIHVATGKTYVVKRLSKVWLIHLKKVGHATVKEYALVKLPGTHPGIVGMHAALQDDIFLCELGYL